MSPIARRRWLLAAIALFTVSAAVLAALASGLVMSSPARGPLEAFAHPGVVIWWLVLGGPFRTIPFSPLGIAFAAAANAASWLLLALCGAAVVRGVRRALHARAE